MIKAISKIDDINKIIRNCLITQGEIDGQFVRNSLSNSGPRLDKQIGENVFNSISHDNELVLFELILRQNDSDMSMTDGNDVLSKYQSFSFNIIIYGDNSHCLAVKLISRLRSEKVRNELYYDGVYVEEVSEPTSLNEFKNDTIWMRTDFAIDISCRLEFSQIDIDNEIENPNDITSIEIT